MQSGLHRLLLTGLLLGLLPMSAAVQAAAPPADFAGQRALILAGLEEGGTHAHLRPADQRQVRRLLDRLQARLGSHAGPEALDAPARQRFAADQARLQALLAGRDDDSQQACEVRGGTGSRFRRTVCSSQEQRQRQQAAGRELLRERPRPQALGE